MSTEKWLALEEEGGKVFLVQIVDETIKIKGLGVFNPAELLAGIIWRGLGLENGILPALWPGEGVVVVTLGGGHYAPRANKIAAIPGVWLGHMLANYALPFEAPEVEGETPLGNWSQSISAAISSTREAFPGGQLVATLERKSFKAWQRNAIIEYLASLDVPVVRTKDIEAMLQ